MQNETLKSYSRTKMPDKCDPNAETNMNNFPVEPINAFSNIIFLAIIIYWTVKTKFRIRLYPLIVITMPLISVGFICGTMFHLLRNDIIWHHLNLLSILYAVIATSVYLWWRVVRNWWKTFFLTLSIPLLFQGFLFFIQPIGKISVGMVFSVMFLSILIPSGLHCLKNGYFNFKYLILSSLFFSIGIIFRTFDRFFIGHHSIGTHFAWHICGGLSIFFFLKYIYESDRHLTRKKFTEKASSF